MPTFSHYYLSEVALVKIACGKLDEGAAGYRAEAREVINYIVAHAGALRGAFLEQQAVAALLAAP